MFVLFYKDLRVIYFNLYVDTISAIVYQIAIVL